MGWGKGGGQVGCEQRIEVFGKSHKKKIGVRKMSEKSTIFKQHLFKKNQMIFFLIFTRESSHCTLQADKSFEPLPILLSEILHLQNCRVHNSKKGNNSKSIMIFFKKIHQIFYSSFFIS